MTSQLSQHICCRHSLLAALCAVAALSTALPAQAAYDSKSSEQDITKSCKDFSVGTDDGVLSATCNVWGSRGTVHDTRSHTIDLDDEIGFDGSALVSDSSNFSDNCDSDSVTLASSKLTLYATCSEKSVSIRVDDLIYNRGAEIGGHAVGLFWRDSGSGETVRDTKPAETGTAQTD